jgi:hypothetical protein
MSTPTTPQKAIVLRFMPASLALATRDMDNVVAMALIPVTCPRCGAAVELKEGQTIVHCAFCKTSSYLERPASQPARPPMTQPTAMQPAVMARPVAARRSSKLSLIVLGLVGLVIAGLVVFATRLSGADLDYFEDARPAAKLLQEKFGKDARYASLLLMPNYMYAVLMRGDDLVAVRIRGRAVESPVPQSKDDKHLEAKLFRISDADFRVVPGIVRHASKRVKGGKLNYLTLERPLPHRTGLLWQAGVEGGGETRLFYYGTDGKPLVEEPLRFLTATPADLGKRFKTQIGFDPRVVSVYLGVANAGVTVITPKSDRDTDAYRFGDDGTMSAPDPESSDGNAEELAAKAFKLDDVDWKIIPSVVADAEKRFGATITQLTIRRDGGSLGMYVYGSTERGSSRSGTYDMSGRFLK